MISQWMCIFGTPKIAIVDRNDRFVGGASKDFRIGRNIVAKTVTHRHRQSLGTPGRKRAHFRGILGHIMGKGNLAKITFKDWAG